jgi:hypothetical protein
MVLALPAVIAGRLEMTEKTDKCAHHLCHCPAPSGGDYCGDDCAKDEDEAEAGCRCGHLECEARYP